MYQLHLIAILGIYLLSKETSKSQMGEKKVLSRPCRCTGASTQ